MGAVAQPVDKAQWRVALLAARRARSASSLATARTAVARAVLSRCAGQGWRRVAAYEPLRTEPGSAELLAGLQAAGCAVIVPVTRPDRDLDWVGLGSSALLGTGAVAAVDAVLVPALAVAADGTRLGRGGGSYDRALARCGAGVETIALLFDGELVPALPGEPWDVPVGAVVTPSGYRAVGRNTGVAPLR
jgi:5-formyltetrahydrofolate cyclo-ligase